MDYGPICGLVLRRTTSPPPKLELDQSRACQRVNFFLCITLQVRVVIAVMAEFRKRARLWVWAGFRVRALDCDQVRFDLGSSRLKRTYYNEAGRLLHCSECQ